MCVRKKKFHVSSTSYKSLTTSYDMIIKHNQFSGQFWKMEGNNLISKAGMVFNSDDKWKLIPLVEANLQAKFEIVNLTCKFWLEIC
jgi:hypothetical protein